MVSNPKFAGHQTLKGGKWFGISIRGFQRLAMNRSCLMTQYSLTTYGAFFSAKSISSML